MREGEARSRLTVPGPYDLGPVPAGATCDYYGRFYGSEYVGEVNEAIMRICYVDGLVVQKAGWALDAVPDAPDPEVCVWSTPQWQPTCHVPTDAEANQDRRATASTTPTPTPSNT